MVTMENAEEVMQILERFTRLKQKEIPKELDDYLQYVAKTGDTVFKWANLKYLFREKLLNVIKNFYDTSPRADEIPQYPNVDPFNYETMKSSLLERLELFNAAPFTIQRLCELLIDPRKQYSRIDKFMRALEKNILVSTIEPGRKRTESENGDSLDSMVNGDLSLDVNVDIDMENEAIFMEAQNGNATVEETAEASGTAKEKPVTASPKSAHRIDDENLPNPKKAKLDLADSEQDEMDQNSSEANQAAATAKPENIEATATELPVKGEDAADAPVEKENPAENGSTESEKEKPKPKAEETDAATKLAEIVVAIVQEKDMDEDSAPVAKIEKSETDKALTENTVEEGKTAEKQETVEADSEVAVKEAMETTEVPVETKKKNDVLVDVGEKKEETPTKAKTDEVDNKTAEIVKEENDEKIIEKQEVEKGEKDEKVPIVEKEDIEKVDAVEVAVEKVAEKANEIVEKIEKVENMETAAAAIEEKSLPDEKEKENITETEEIVSTSSVVAKAVPDQTDASTAADSAETAVDVNASEKTETVTEETTAKSTAAESIPGDGEKSASNSESTTSETTVDTTLATESEPTTAASADEISSTITEKTTETTKIDETADKTETKEVSTNLNEEVVEKPAVEVEKAVELKETEALAVEISKVETAETSSAKNDSETAAVAETAVEQSTNVETSTPAEESAAQVLPQPADAEEAVEAKADVPAAVVPAEVLIAVPEVVEHAMVDDELPAVAEVATSAAPAALEIITTTTPTSSDIAPPIVVIPPTLALNDQPMEDMAIVESSIVEEVIMAESTCAANEMTTDAMDAAKDEPSGMEVDDTSQEAMDQ